MQSNSYRLQPFPDNASLLAAFVWLANGFFCKILNLVPRHQQIVARILGEEHSLLFTKTIGCLEILMAIWIVSKIKHRLCTLFQILLIATMNMLEFCLAPDLLLFGRWNIIVASAFIALLLSSEGSFLRKEQTKPTFNH